MEYVKGKTVAFFYVLPTTIMKSYMEYTKYGYFEHWLYFYQGTELYIDFYIILILFVYFSLERFNETMFDAYNLFVLSICHVCGSYQCPYCPVFSWSNTIAPNPFTLLIIIISYFLWKSSMHKL